MESNDWISVKDRLPEVGREVLAFTKYNIELAGKNNTVATVELGCIYKDGVWCECTNEEAINVTHWQPLPEPPKG